MSGRKWNKLGRIFTPAGGHPELLSHAANPLPVHMSGDVYRIFFNGRDAGNRSAVGAFDFDIMRREVIEEYHAPFFSAGPPGSFYADGVSIGNCYRVGNVTYLVFMGWQNPPDAHWRGDIGRLIVHDDYTLSLAEETAFIPADHFNGISLSYPWVQAMTSGGYEMWYGVTYDNNWDAGNGEMLHVLRRAVSANGHEWADAGDAIPFALGVAQAFSRPTVLVGPDGAEDMWFSYRSGDGTPYRIGHSRKTGDGWTMPPGDPGIDVSAAGWDSEMIEYPFVFRHAGQVYMLYNGNSYGKTGIGLAELVQ